MEYCTYNYLPLRCIDKYYSYINLIGENLNFNFVWYVALLILVKILRPTLYDSFINRNEQAAQALTSLFTDSIRDSGPDSRIFKVKIRCALQAYYNQTNDIKSFCSDAPAAENKIADACRNIGGPKDAFHIASQYVDFKIF